MGPNSSGCEQNGLVMQINMKSLFAEAETCFLYSKEVTFSDSFLSFASYVEQNDGTFREGIGKRSLYSGE